MARTIEALAALGFLAVLYVLAGTWDHADALTHEAQAKLDRAEAITAAGESVARLSHPILYDATIRDCLPSGRECTRERYYVRSSDAQR